MSFISDITIIHKHKDFLFLAVVMDLFARNNVGWSMSDRSIEDLVLDTSTAAYWHRKPNKTVNFHSDRVRNIPGEPDLVVTTTDNATCGVIPINPS